MLQSNCVLNMLKCSSNLKFKIFSCDKRSNIPLGSLLKWLALKLICSRLVMRLKTLSGKFLMAHESKCRWVRLGTLIVRVSSSLKPLKFSSFKLVRLDISKWAKSWMSWETLKLGFCDRVIFSRWVCASLKASLSISLMRMQRMSSSLSWVRSRKEDSLIFIMLKLRL